MWESTNWKTGTKEAHEKYGTSGLKFHLLKTKMVNMQKIQKLVKHCY